MSYTHQQRNGENWKLYYACQSSEQNKLLQEFVSKTKKNIGILLKLEEHTRQLGLLFCVLETVTLRQNKK